MITSPSRSMSTCSWRISRLCCAACSSRGVPSEAGASLQVGDLLIDPLAHTVSLAGRVVDLSPREFDLLHALALEPGRVFSVNDLLASVWGAEFAGQPQVVYVHIRWLREKLERDPNRPELIQTVRGVGYKLVSAS